MGSTREEVGYSAAAVAAIDAGLQNSAARAQETLAKAGKWVYHYQNNNLVVGALDPQNCVRSLLSANASGATANQFVTWQMDQFKPEEQTGKAPTLAHYFQQNLAAFLLTRGDYSFFGAVGGGDAEVMGGPSYFAPEFSYDFGEPEG